jgi:superfamily II DNA/RNA helicase
LLPADCFPRRFHRHAMVRFCDLSLSPCVLSAVSALGFDEATPVQGAVIPHFMGHADVCVQAVTGSGKTLAFAVPLVERLLRAGGFGGAAGSAGAAKLGARARGELTRCSQP